MDNWFSKAANVFRREKDEQPLPFQLTCECGQDHVGLRRNRHQHVVCKSCGSSVFVLARDVYPAPKEPKRASQLPVEESRDDIPARLAHDPVVDQPVANEELISPELVEEVPENPEPYRTVKRKTVAERPPGMEITQVELPLTPRERKERERAREERESRDRERASRKSPAVPAGPPLSEVLGGMLRSLFTPFKILAMGFVLLLALSAFLLIRQLNQQSAQRTIQADLEAGRVAATEGDWIAARDHFEAATQAVDVLHRTDPEASEIRQMFRESTALTRLSPESLLDLLDEAEEYERTHKPEEISPYLLSRHGVDWYVIDAPVKPRTVDPAAKPKVENPFEVVFPWIMPESGRSVRVEADMACFAELVENEPRPVLFGAQLAGCQLEGNTWVIRLEPRGGFVWSNRMTYEALRLPENPDRPIEQLEPFLEAQAKVMGMKP